jgi:hypothetical protein
MKIKHFASKAAMAALLLTGLASAQTNPDVVVHQIGVDGGDTNDIIYYGNAEGIAAYSFGTQSCNIGTTELVWGSTQNHPVISQNMFRLKDERFLHVGQSWLKHGFCAVNEPGCGTCQSSPCSTLGVGCADTYWGSLNDGRTGGPKYQIAASIGSHPHPFPSPAGNNTIRGRLQVHLEDIDQSVNGNGSAQYFIEAQYISEDDAIHGNAGNNASWRKVDVISHTNVDGDGPTNVGEEGLHAWKDAVPSVELTRISNLNEGGTNRHAFYWLGCNVKDNNDGTFTYMYAVHNLNSSQACGAFTIPINPSANLTNVFFHDVDYHSGEPYNGLDWTHSIGGGEITWETAETYAQNNDANALRWGTVYNFGFTTGSAPQDVTAILDMFEPGIATSLSGPTKGPGTPPDVYSYCNSNQNSSGGAAQIYTLGSNSIGANDLILGASPVPVNQFGIFYYGSNEIEVPFGNGIRCVGGGVNRLPVEQSDNFFNIAHSVNNGQAPHSANLTPGSTWKFQCWFRDTVAGGSGFNLSNGKSITFQN